MNCGFFFCVCYAKYYFLKNTNPKNQIIFLFCPPTNPTFFVVLPIDPKINLVLVNEAELRDDWWLGLHNAEKMDKKALCSKIFRMRRRRTRESLLWPKFKNKDLEWSQYTNNFSTQLLLVSFRVFLKFLVL